MVVNAILPALSSGAGSILGSAENTSDRIKTAIEIIHVAPRATGEIRFWVKNIGATDIQNLEGADVFIEGSDEYRMTFSSDSPPADCSGNANVGKWFYAYEDDHSYWAPLTTVRVTVCVGGGTPKTVYFTTASGVTAKEPI